MKAHKKKIIIALIILLAAPCLFFLVKNKIHMKRVRAYVKEEKFALAKHELEKVTCLTPKSLADCTMMLDIYLKSYDLSSLEYMAELCQHKGFKDKLTILHKSKARELRGDFAGALGIIGAEINSGSGSGSATEPDYFLTAAQLLTRMNNAQGAVSAYINLFKLAGDNLELKFKALGGILELKANAQAMELAKILGAQTFNQPIPYFVLAKIFLQLNDRDAAKTAYDKALPLLATVQEKERSAILNSFQDVTAALQAKKEESGKR